MTQTQAQTWEKRLSRDYELDYLTLMPVPPITGYVPTRPELVGIVRFWCGVILDIERIAKLGDGSFLEREVKLIAFAKERIKHVEAVLGEELLERELHWLSGDELLEEDWLLKQGQDLAEMHSQAVKVEEYDNCVVGVGEQQEEMHPETDYTFADGSTLVACHGRMGAVSFGVAPWPNHKRFNASTGLSTAPPCSDDAMIFNVRRSVPYRAHVRANGVWQTGMVVSIDRDGTVAQFQPDGSEQTIGIVPDDVDELGFIGEKHEEPPFAWKSSPSTI